MENLEDLRIYLTTKLRDYSECQTQWNGDLQAESQELLNKLQVNPQLELVTSELEKIKDSPDFSIQSLVDIMNSSMEAIEVNDDALLAHITVSRFDLPVISVYSLISFIDFYFQYNIGNVKFVSKEDEIVLHILKYIDNEDVLDMDIDINPSQIVPTTLGASKLLNTLEHFYEDGYNEVQFKLLPDEEILLVFLKHP